MAAALDVSPITIGAVERGERLPALDLLARMANLLEPDHAQRSELIARWLAKWVQHKAEAVGEGLPGKAELEQAASDLVAALSSPQRALPPVYPRSLQGFPEQFQPLVAVFPDRREAPPESPADLFIQGGSATDFQYLPLLPRTDEPLRVCSDKFFVLMPRDWLVERFQCNLLVVGSAGVNWLTRQLAARTLFRPLIERSWLAWDNDYRRRSELDDATLLLPFWRLLEQAQHQDSRKIDPLGLPAKMLGPAQSERLGQAADMAEQILAGETPSHIIQQFRVPGFADPADAELHGRLPGDNNDFGTISLAPHPFDDTGRFVSIVCAGISGPGTAHGLKGLFTRQDLFADHPFGGVIKVDLPAREDWPGKFEKADWRWQTDGYKPDDLEKNLIEALAAPGPSTRRHAFRSWDEAELRDALAFVRLLRDGPGGTVT